MQRTIRPFRCDEAAILATIRLEALTDLPEAFAERLDAALASGGEDFTLALAAGEVWGVFHDQACVGMAGLERHVGANVAHKATIWGVYISPQARGAGDGVALFEALIAQAKQIGVEVLELGVGDFNDPARQLYQRMGFTPYGLERRALKLNGAYIDEVLMALFLLDA